jgi:hypothetical protein
MGTRTVRCWPSEVGPGVGVAVGVAVGLGVGVRVGVSLGVAVALAVAVGVGVGDRVGVAVAVAVGLGVLVAVGVGEGATVSVGAGEIASVGMALARAGAPAAGSAMAAANGWEAMGPRQDSPLPRSSSGIKRPRPNRLQCSRVRRNFSPFASSAGRADALSTEERSYQGARIAQQHGFVKKPRASSPPASRTA